MEAGGDEVWDVVSLKSKAKSQSSCFPQGQ